MTNTSSSRLETTGTSAKLGNINKKPVSSENLPKKSAQTANKPNNIAKNNKNSSSSSSSSNSSQNSGSSYSGSGSGSEEESSSPSGNSLRNAGVSSQRPALIKKTAPQNNSTPINLSENTGKTLKTTNNLNTFCNNNNNNINELDLSNAKSTHTVNSDDHLSQQIKSLLKDSAHGSKESAKLDLFLRKDERYAKKPSKGSEDEEDEMFAEFSAQKIKQLELKLSAKLKENSENLEKIRELQGENIQVF
ncbi:MAG: hypothetical protein H6620_12255 [Halobacteriovoraceae bacterium]|nr:hypothetical protein [Halobacteriovoraceae bacterium]